MPKALATIIVAAMVLSAPALAGNDCATRDGYLKLQTGMSYAQAKKIIGCEGEEVTSSEMAGFKTIIYMWYGGGLSSLSGANMNVMFQNDKLINKAQMGLK